MTEEQREVVNEAILSLVSFRDEGHTYLTDIKRPTFIYDKTTLTRVSYGDYEYVVAKLTTMQEAYRKAGFDSMADDLKLLEVRPSQDLVDALFQSNGMFASYLKRTTMN